VSTAEYPGDLKYHEAHDWAKIDGDVATFGITWYAQDALGDVVFFDPPDVGATVTANEPYGELESVKAVSDLISPLDGEVLEVNDDVVSTPEKVNTEPYTAWLLRVKLADPGQVDSLLSADAYQQLLG